MSQYHAAHIDQTEWQSDARFPGVFVQVMISKVQNDVASIIRGRVAPNGIIATHTHETETELVYVLAGSATVTLGEDTITLIEGSSLLIPAGLPHSVKNEGDMDWEIIAIHTPPTR